VIILTEHGNKKYKQHYKVHFTEMSGVSLNYLGKEYNNRICDVNGSNISL